MDKLENYNITSKIIEGTPSFSIKSKQDSKKCFNSNEIKSVWFRRSSTITPLDIQNITDIRLRKNIVSNTFSEFKYFMESIYHFSGLNKVWLNHYSTVHNDKLLTLISASKLGILIPDTIITTSKQELINFRSKYADIIIKPIFNVELFKVDEMTYMTYTELLEKQTIDNLPNYIFPTLCQEHVEKDFEIRSVFLNNKIFSMAMFSQKDNQTKIDFRKYNFVVPNRTIPYQLPLKLEKVIIKLMKELNLNSGSIDFIKTKSGQYVFLEVNPVGQFGMTSYPCRYGIEKEMALFLGNN
jgi:ATP-GRASP peptide maturase of grasp-with-spasm system